MSDSLWWLPSLLIFAIAAVIAIVAIAALRRGSERREAVTDSSLVELQRRAGGLLVRTDNRVQESEDELGFALAQFGDAAVVDYRRAIETARRRLREAFLLQQRLDDAEPDTIDERRRWNTQIIELCTSADAALAGEDARFRELRSTERNAPQQFLVVQTQLAAAEARADEIRAVRVALAARFSPTALTVLERHLDEASELLVSASGLLQTAALRMQSGGIDPVADALRSAHDDVSRSGAALSAAEAAAARISAAELAANGLAAQLRDGIEEARRVRDGHVDPASAATLNLGIDQAAMAIAEHARLARSGSAMADPLADLDALRSAIDRLDSLTSAARGQQDRLEHARLALGGALVAARSHIAVARDCILERRGVVGAPARTRLAEAERQLMLAEAESDPVDALDIARRAVRHADDAEALARYDAEVRGA